MLNDSTFCTDTSEVIDWGNKLKVLRAEKDYLKEQLAVVRVQYSNSSQETAAVKDQLKAVRRELFRKNLKSKLDIAIAAAVFGYGGYQIGKISN